MSARSRSAAGLRRYSAMLRIHPAQKAVKIEGSRLAALLALDQGLPDRVDFKAPLLLAPNEIADRLAVIGILAGFDLRGDPGVLLVGEGYGLAHRSHDEKPFRSAIRIVEKFILLVRFNIA